MTRSLIFGGAAVAALLGGAALAQQPAPAPDLNRAPIPPTHDYSQPAPSSTTAGSGYSAPPVGAVTSTQTTTQGVTNNPTTTYGSSSATTTSATTSGTNASTTTQLVTNGPVPDTPANRQKYGGPMSRAGRHTRAAGN